MLNPFLLCLISVYFLPLFIKAKTATTRTMTTSANTPIIQMPFSHDTKGMFINDFTMYWFLCLSQIYWLDPIENMIILIKTKS